MSLNQTNFPSVPITSVEAMLQPWAEVIQREECAIVSFPPRGGAYRRIEHLIKSPSLQKSLFGKNFRKYRLKDYSAFGQAEVSVADLASGLLANVEAEHSQPINSPQAFISSLEKVLAKSKAISFFIYDTDEWFTHSRLDIMVFLSKVSQLQPRIRFLLFCELDVTSPEILKLNLGTTTLTQNIITVPLYSRSDITYFIHELERFWHVSIPPDVIQKILDQAGCHIWLVKEVVRLYLQKQALPKRLVDQPTMRFKLEALWQQLSDSERQLLSKLANHQPLSKFHYPASVFHLESIGFIAPSGDQFRLTLPILEEFIQQKTLQSSFELTPDQEIYLEGKNASHRFGQLEKKALVCLLQHTGNLVTREELGKVLWPESEDSYSEWALDRLMSRLRHKIYACGVNPERLTTIKKAGWIWE